jgi:hypothetical protein
MFSLLPIADPVRNALDAQVLHFSKLVGWANIAVAVGVAIEGVEFLHDAITWIKRRRLKKKELSAQKELTEIFPAGEVRLKAESNSDHPRWVKRFTRIGLIVVVVGVVAEWRCGAKLEDAHNAVHEYDLVKLTEADQKAGEAATSAKTAHNEADVATKASKEAQQKAVDAKATAGEAQAKAGAAEASAERVNVIATRAQEEAICLSIEAQYIAEGSPDGPLRFPDLRVLNELANFPAIKAEVSYESELSTAKEPLAYAEVIIHTLRSIGWDVPVGIKWPRKVFPIEERLSFRELCCSLRECLM